MLLPHQSIPGKPLRKALIIFGVLPVFCLILVFLLPGVFLPPIANFLIADEKPVHADAVVVLSTGMEYFSRLMEAAELYNSGYADKVVINGNRKNAEIRKLEDLGFDPCCEWQEEPLRILEVLGVSRGAVIAISAEDVYDTVSEAKAVGNELIASGCKSLIITTSKTHTRRALHIWKDEFSDIFELQSVAARHDPFSAQKWWKEGRQTRWILYEYGSWCFYYWQKITGK
ncbi:MAG: YdcF family protein [Proteobacteria bacterium]|nr:YdcF family protein [Pseudomonadota bacterium]MBU1709832.1 YdcF family protein [Pseudomonadota bacterium]